MESSIAVFLKRQLACEQLPMKYKASEINLLHTVCSFCFMPSFSFRNLECRRHLSLPNFGIEKLLVAWKFFVFSLGSKFWRELCVSQRSLHNAPIFRLLLKVAVNGTHQCDFQNFCGQQCPTRSTRIWVLQCLNESIFRAWSAFVCSQDFSGWV